MLKNKGGYILIDCGGMDLTKGETPQTINGLYARCQEALESGKAILADNCKWGTKPVTPFSTLAIQLYDDTVVATANTLQIWVTNEDVVTIVNLVA